MMHYETTKTINDKSYYVFSNKKGKTQIIDHERLFNGKVYEHLLKKYLTASRVNLPPLNAKKEA